MHKVTNEGSAGCKYPLVRKCTIYTDFLRVSKVGLRHHHLQCPLPTISFLRHYSFLMVPAFVQKTQLFQSHWPTVEYVHKFKYCGFNSVCKRWAKFQTRKSIRPCTTSNVMSQFSAYVNFYSVFRMPCNICISPVFFYSLVLRWQIFMCPLFLEGVTWSVRTSFTAVSILP